jgi:hypothetical protein
MFIFVTIACCAAVIAEAARRIIAPRLPRASGGLDAVTLFKSPTAVGRTRIPAARLSNSPFSRLSSLDVLVNYHLDAAVWKPIPIKTVTVAGADGDIEMAFTPTAADFADVARAANYTVFRIGVTGSHGYQDATATVSADRLLPLWWSGVLAAVPQALPNAAPIQLGEETSL